MNKEKKSNLKSMLSYSVADMLGGGAGMVISTYYYAFLTLAMGLSPLQAGIVTGIGKVWDGITDPVMGNIVDRTNTRFGSCRPYFLISAVPVFVSYFMLWYCFGITGAMARTVYFSFAYMLWSTAFTLAVVPYEALLPRMVDSYKERTNYSSMRMIFSGVACVASTYIYELIVNADINQATTKEFVILGIVLGLFFSIPMVITFFGTKETHRPNDRKDMTLREVFREYKEMLSSKIYRKYYALGLCGATAANAISVTATIFIYLVFGNQKDFVWTFTLVFVTVNLKGAFEIAFFPLNMLLMKKYNKHRPLLIDLPFILAGALIILFITPSSSPWLYIFAACLIGCGVSCLGFVPMTLLPDLTDVDEMIYGLRREGVNAGLTTLGKKIVAGLTITLFGAILAAYKLDNLTLVTPELLASDSTPLAALKMMYCAVPLVFCTIMLLISRTYNLDEKTHGLIKRLIAEKRAGQPLTATEEEKSICRAISGIDFDKMWIGQPYELLPVETENTDTEA